LQQSTATYALPGFLGATFMAIGSLGIGWYPISVNAMRWPIVNFFLTQNLGIALARAFLVVGAALLIQAWLMVGVDIIKERFTKIRSLYIIFASWALPLAVSVPLFSRDVYSYYMQGRMQLLGHSPYRSGVEVVPGWFSSGVDPLWGSAPSPYGPLFLWFEKVIAQISGNSALTSVLWFRSLSIAGVIMLCIQVPKLAQRHGINPVAALWLGVLNPLIIFHFITGAHNDGLMLALTVWAINLALDKRFVQSLCLLVAAVAIKPSALVAMPFLAFVFLGYLAKNFAWAARAKSTPQLSGNTAISKEADADAITEIEDEHSHYKLSARILIVGVATMASVALLALISAFVGVHPFGWLAALVRPGSVRSWLAPSTMIGIVSSTFFHAMGFANHADKIIMICRIVGEVLLLGGLTYVLDTLHRRAITRSIALAFVVLVICSPAVQPWYLLWFIPLLAVTGLTQKHLRIVIAFIVGFAIHDIANSAETGNGFLGFSDTVAIIVSVLILLVAIATSPRERELLLGTPNDSGIIPTDMEQLARWNSMRFN